jgi:hypothetical protein
VVRRPERDVREFTRACVRAGLLPADALHDEVAQAIAGDLPDRAADADDLARAWVQEAHEELRRDQAGWPDPTDYERLQAAFADLEDGGVVVLQGCEDHWSAKAVLDARASEGAPPRGIAWFTPPDVWHAVDEGMLEVNLWHGTTANAAPGDDLLHEVVGTLERHGLDAHFDEGRIEVAAHWHRRVT